MSSSPWFNSSFPSSVDRVSYLEQFSFSADLVVRKLAHQLCSAEFELDADIRVLMVPLLKAGDVMEVGES